LHENKIFCRASIILRIHRLEKLNFSPHSAINNLATIFHTVLQLRKNLETPQEDREGVKRILPRRSRARRREFLR